VVGCDGARSTVRRAAKIAFQGGAYPQTFALADLRVGRQGDYRLCAGGRQLRRGTRTGVQGSKLVAAGNVGPFFDFGLARCKADGTLDRSFGSGGKVTTDFGC
jgi:2-polyprenyl-6-methoxyphenol hydroxylase-like FAD-dependent oxidoreductase